MSQRHLYGLDYSAMNPPQEWQTLTVESTTRDDAFERVEFEQELNFSGQIAKYVIDEYLPTYGACNGLHYRIEQQSDTTDLVEIIFDGYIDLLRWTLNSLESYQFSAPIKSFDRKATVFDRMSIVNQGFLRDKGFILPTDFVSIAVFREAKTAGAERIILLRGLFQDILTIFLNMIQNVLSAVADIAGVSAPIGVLELIALFLGLIPQLNSLVDLILANKDLLFPEVSFYKGLSVKTTLDKAFQYLGMSVEYGEIESVISKMVLMPTQNEFDGFLSADDVGGDGQLKPNDFGYFITDLMAFVQDFFNGKQSVDGSTIHIKNKFDPFWDEAPELVPLPLVNETTKQYSNGTKSNDLDDFYATWYANYRIDVSDPWTLTAKSGDSYEIHRELVTELDPRTNSLNGLKEVKLPYAMAVRKEEAFSLWDIFLGINAKFDEFLGQLQGTIEDVLDKISAAAESLPGDIMGEVDGVLGFSFLTDLINFENRVGALKMQDNVTAVPKLLYLENDGAGKLRIPENFKDIIGGKAIYENYYIKDSPADVNDYQGQRTKVNDWGINFDVDDFAKTKNNQNTEFEGKSSKFMDISWEIEKYQALTNLKVTEIFDTNITEVEINQPE